MGQCVKPSNSAKYENSHLQSRPHSAPPLDKEVENPTHEN